MKQISICLSLFCFASFAWAGSSSWPKYPLRGANVSTNVSGEDLRHFAHDWKGQVVRILHLTPLSEQAPYTVNEKVLNEMYATAKLALDQNLVVVFAPGVAMDNNDGFFSSHEYRQAFLGLWKRIAEHFKDEPKIVAFDLMNEPHDKKAQTEWSIYAKELTQEIRKIDQAHSLIVEPPEWGWPSGFVYLQPTGDKNTIYSFHSYAPNEFTMQKTSKGFLTASEAQWQSRTYPGSVMEGETWNKKTMSQKLQPAFDFAQKNHVSLWCGEFGVARWAKGAFNWMQDMIDIFEAHGIGWAYYSYREWQAMDLEMSSSIKNKKTAREENDFVHLLKKSYAK